MVLELVDEVFDGRGNLRVTLQDLADAITRMHDRGVIASTEFLADAG